MSVEYIRMIEAGIFNYRRSYRMARERVTRAMKFDCTNTIDL